MGTSTLPGALLIIINTSKRTTKVKLVKCFIFTKESQKKKVFSKKLVEEWSKDTESESWHHRGSQSAEA